MASLLSVEDEDGQQGWEEAMDGSVGEEKAPTRGLFTDELFDTPEDALKRATADSNFDLLKLIQDVGGDFYTSIKIVNYVRSKAMGGETPSAVEAELRHPPIVALGRQLRVLGVFVVPLNDSQDVFVRGEQYTLCACTGTEHGPRGALNFPFENVLPVQLDLHVPRASITVNPGLVVIPEPHH